MQKKGEKKKNNKKKNHREYPIFIIPKTFGQKSADWITNWAGSWVFILLFLGFLVLWMIINTSWIIFGESWDPYPFILLNLVLSCVAAIQAPIILMSQNRENQRDRARAEYDYAVNRKAEKEIREIKKQLNRIEEKLRKKKGD
ncbi:MAG: DUF1003 domain-containing protein [Nanoarchaeota archaeon]|nr:DUF1003 domain-containing protein [Nanoarchaeota archaeon]